MKSKLLIVFLALLGVSFAQSRPPAPFLGPEKPEFVVTLVPGMAYPTLQPTLDTFLARHLAVVESSFEVALIARGTFTAEAEATGFVDQAFQYCALMPATEPCQAKTAEASAKVYASRYMAWASQQPLSVYVQGGDPDIAITGAPIVKPLPPPVAELSLVGDCYDMGNGTQRCSAPGAAQKKVPGESLVTWQGRQYRVHVTKSQIGTSYWAEPI